MDHYKETVKQLVSVISKTLKSAGFQRRGRIWSLECKMVTHVIRLRHIQFGHNYCLDLGIWLNELCQPETSDPLLCHINIQVENLYPSDAPAIVSAVDIDQISTSSLAWLQEFLVARLIPYLLSLDNYQTLRSEILDGGLRLAGRRAGVKEYFGLA